VIIAIAGCDGFAPSHGSGTTQLGLLDFTALMFTLFA